MKKHFKLTPVAMAVAALCASPAALASEDGHFHKSYDEDVNVEVDNYSSVSLSKSVYVDKEVYIAGEIGVFGYIPITSSAMSVIDDKQLSHDNYYSNTIHDNNARVGDNALNGSEGNVGVNVTAGDGNVQDNSAALSAADAYFVFGSADAEIFANQDSVSNSVSNSGTSNNARLGGTALQGSNGNIGVNISAGNNNLQKGNLAVSHAAARMAEATVSSLQQTGDNETSNQGHVVQTTTTSNVSVSGTLSGGYTGSTGGSYSGSESGRYSGGGAYSGQSDQIGNVYLDNWAPCTSCEQPQNHPTNGSNVGHTDVDSAAQGAQDLNGDGGAFAFNEDGEFSESGSYAGRESGSYSGSEVGVQALAGTLSGTVTTTQTVFRPSENNASMGGDALAGASGNISVNIASGTGNVQANNLAVAATRAALGAPNGGGEIPAPTPGEQ